MSLCGSVVIYPQLPHWWICGLPLCSLRAGDKYRISQGWYVSEYNYRSGEFCTINEEFKCPKYKTECSNIQLHKGWIELEKWDYLTVKINKKLFCM